MSTRIALVLSIILAGISAIGVRAWIENERKSQAERYERVPILVARETIRPETQLSNDHFGSKWVAKNLVTADMIHWDERLRYVGKVTTRAIPRTETIFKSFLISTTSQGGTSANPVRDGMRAVAIRVDQFKAPGFLVRPGDYVDVMGTFEVPKKAGTSGSLVQQSETVCLLEGAKVLAVDNRTEDLASRRRGTTTDAYRSITLEVSPTDGAKLIHAEQEGELKLMLRPPGEPSERPLSTGGTYRWDQN